MKVTIDTKEDTHEDIKKVLHILTEILERKSSSSDSLSTASSLNTAPLMSMFDETPASSTSSEAKKDTAPDFGSFLNLTKSPEKKETQPRIEIF